MYYSTVFTIIQSMIFSKLSHCSIYEIEETNDKSGMIIENGPPVKIVRGHWKIVHYLDIDELMKIILNMQKGISDMKNIFSRNLDILLHKLDKINNVRSGLNSILDKR